MVEGTSFVEKKHGTRRELFKPAALVVGGHHKKWMVQALILPMKKSLLKGGVLWRDMEGRGE